MADQTHVLFVEDDDVIREATQLALERDGFAVTAMPDGVSGLEAFRADRPDIALLDVMVPGMDGVSLCRRIRDESTVPVIMLSARADSIDVVLGLEAGADDYVTKPFDGAVLVARIRAVLRRFGHASGGERGGDEADSAATAGCWPSVTWRSTPRAWRCAGPGSRSALTPTEMRLLLEFSSAPGTVLSRDKLLERVWDYGWGGDTRVVDVHVQRLRRRSARTASRRSAASATSCAHEAAGPPHRGPVEAERGDRAGRRTRRDRAEPGGAQRGPGLDAGQRARPRRRADPDRAAQL